MQSAFEGFRCTLIISDLGVNWDNLENFTNQSAQMSEVMLNRTIPLSGQKDIAAVLLLEILLIFAESLDRLLPILDTIFPSKFVKDLLSHTYDLPSRQITFMPDGKNVLSTPILRLNATNGKFETAATCKSDNNLISILRPSLWAWFGDGRFPPDVPLCGFEGNSCKAIASEVIAPMAAVALLICLSFLTAYIIRKKAEESEFLKILLQNMENDRMLKGSLVVPLGNPASKFTVMHNTKLRSVILEMSRLLHPNIGSFHGINLNKESLSLVWEFSKYGNVNDFLLSRPVLRDDAIRLSLLWDLLQGLFYIHGSALQFHGALKTAVCFISSRYSLKIATTGCFHLLECLGNQQTMQFPTLRKMAAYYRSEDVRCFGIISETFLADNRTTPPSLAYEKWTQLTNQCQQEVTADRPSLTQIKKQFTQLNLPQNFVDYVIRIMEEHNQQLEFIVSEKTKILVEERHNVDRLLAEMLPGSVVHKLRVNEETSVETFDSASVLFSDIPGFCNFSSSGSPWDTIILLNTVYSEFDSIFGLYDAYKVETVNDSYMVNVSGQPVRELFNCFFRLKLTSGIPTRNGTQHAYELCVLALHLLSAAEACLTTYELTARIGISSGPVVAGVIGSKMPRYCLFGDTVNTASRMETSGEAGKIHVSESARNLAEDGKGLLFVPRGLISIKGKGEMKTFWLHSSTDATQADTKVDDPSSTS